MSKICRLCLKTESEQYNDMEIEDYRLQLRLIAPEIDIETVENPVICSNCADLLMSAYLFKTMCLETDERIKSFVKANAKVRLDEIFSKQEELDDDVKEELADLDVDVSIEEIYVNDDSNKDPVKLERDTSTKKKVVCKLCNKSYKLAGRRWVEHVKSHFKEKYVCLTCLEGFEVKSSYILHKQEKHSKGFPDNNCTICSKKFLYLSNLEKHMVKHDERGEKSMHCEICNLKVSSTARLLEHMRVHTGERPFQCTYCGKAFAQNSTLSTHVRSIHMSDRPHVCQICGRSFPVKGAYTAHMKVHQPLEKNCVCHFCGNGFRMQSLLRKHLKWHIGAKEFVCQVCKKGFINNHGLKKHMRMHNGEKPFECHLCHKRFTQSGNKKIHLKSCVRRQPGARSDINTNCGDTVESGQISA